MPAFRLILCLAAAALVAGCGSASSPPTKTLALPAGLGGDWATQADAIAAAAAAPGGGCHARLLAVALQREVSAQRARISPRLYDPLAAGVDALVADLPCAPPPKGPKPGKGPPKDHGHGHGHGGDQGNQAGEGG